MSLPKLRFPEFRDEREWGITCLIRIADRITQRNSDNNVSRVLSNSAVDGVVDQRDYFDKDIANQDNLQNYFIVDKGDYVYNPRVSTTAPVGPISKNKIGKGVMSPLYTVFRFHNSMNDFFEHFFHTNIWHKYLKEVSNSGARHDRMALSNEDFMNMPLPLPNHREQQKIADCLSSLDDLIVAHNHKLDALKTHKKGLMQQLFPTEGETVPRLRFPEFKDDGEWEEMELNQLGELVSGLTYSPNDVQSDGLLVLRSSNVRDGKIVLNDNVYVRKDISGANRSKPNDILICVRNGSKTLIGKNALIPDGMPDCTHGAFMTVFRSKSAQFIFQLFQTDAYDSQVSANLGATINSINGNQLKKFKFYIPKPTEQQRIADCLSSLGNLITAQTQKIEALKAHKKGLMQQLFPQSAEDGV